MFKSKFEEKVFSELLNGKATYETDTIKYVEPPKNRRYIPDFKLRENVYVEAKGRFTREDRLKHLLIKQQHPEITIYILFQNPRTKIEKGSKYSYGDWCTKHNIKFSSFKEGIPDFWITGK